MKFESPFERNLSLSETELEGKRQGRNEGNLSISQFDAIAH